MPVRRVITMGLCCYCLVMLLAGCNLSAGTFPGAQSTTTAPDGSGKQVPLDTWQQTAPGVELRFEHWKSPGNNEDTVTIVRMDLQQVHLSIGYQPDDPLPMNAWMKQSHARAIINGGYFDKSNRPTGLLVSNGQFFGSSYANFGGMLSVDTQGHAHLRSLRQQPYAGEALRQATQSSPMMIIDGQRTEFQANAVSDRRSSVAIDKTGHLLFIVSPGPAFSLDEFADLLATSDLSIQNALNLDGGASTGLAVHGTDSAQDLDVEPLTALPIVIIAK